jgi:putative nucleotidyltransferase with HDIG domain
MFMGESMVKRPWTRVDDPEGNISPVVPDPDHIVRRELAAILPVIAETMREQTAANACSFYIYDRDVTRTVASFRHGESIAVYKDLAHADTLPPQAIPIERDLLRHGGYINRSTDSDFERWPLLNDEVRLRTDQYVDVAIPLQRNGNAYGVVYLWRHGGRGPFTPDEVETAYRLAQIAAMAVEFARLYVEERVNGQSLNALLEVATLASSHLTVDDVMPAVTRIVRTVTDADVCNLYVFDDSRNVVEAAFSEGLNESERWAFEQSDVYPVSVVPAEERARATLSPVVVRDLEADLAPDSELIHYAREARISEILVVPIVYHQNMIGVIYLWYRDPDRTFSEQAASTAQGIANQAGGVVSQARLYDESRQHIAEIDALRRIGDAVLRSDSLNSVLDEIADVLKTMIPHDYAFVGTISDDGEAIVIRRVWGKFPPEVVDYRIPIEGSLTGIAVRSRAVLNQSHVFNSERMHRFEPEHLPIHSVLIAPLVTEGGAAGAIYIGRHRSERFTSRQERLMTLLSQQATAAIERMKAREALALYAERQTFLASVTNRLLSVEEPADALQKIAELGCGHLADGVVIALSSWRYGELRWAGAAHVDPERDRVLRQRVLGGGFDVNADRIEKMLAAETGSLMKLEDGRPIDGRPLEPSAIDLFATLESSEVLTTPMRQRGRAPGLLILISTDPERNLDDDVRAMAQLVADRIGDALERRRMVHNREALLRMSQAINSHPEMETLLDLFMLELQRIVPYDQLYLGRLDPELGATRPLAFLNPLGMRTWDDGASSNSGIIGEVLRSDRAILENDLESEIGSSYAIQRDSSYYAKHGESAMAAPLIAEDSTSGVLFVGRSGSNRFSDSDFETFLLFAGMLASAIHRTELVQNNHAMYRASVEVLAAVVDAKDPTTLKHSQKVAHYARALAVRYGLSEPEIEQVELAGLLHDIGKLGIPDHILSKPGPLTEAERALINAHPQRGANILRQHPALTELVPLVLHHHEWFNGGGYPSGLRGDQIPVGACIISVADTFDTMVSHRTYKQRRTIQEALDELLRCAGTQFQPELIEAFVDLVRTDPELLAPGPETNGYSDASPAIRKRIEATHEPLAHVSRMRDLV